MAYEIEATGDKRIPDAGAVSEQFIREVYDEAAVMRSDKPHPVLQYLNSIGIEEIDLTASMTFGEVADLAKHRHRLRLINERIGLPYDVLKKVATPDRVPSHVIQEAINAYSQRLNERRGSELVDKYLVCLAPYVDACYVDKRTLENVERAKRHSGVIRELTASVRKSASYIDTLKDLETSPR